MEEEQNLLVQQKSFGKKPWKMKTLNLLSHLPAKLQKSFSNRFWEQSMQASGSIAAKKEKERANKILEKATEQI